MSDEMLSILMPVRDQAETVVPAIRRLLDFEWPLAVEVLVIDEGSSDDTVARLESAGFPSDRVRVIGSESRIGRRTAIRQLADHASGRYLAWHFADLAYSIDDLAALLDYLRTNRADAVIGSRYLGPGRSVTHYWRARGHRFVTLLSNALTDLNLTDATSGCWVIRREVWQRLRLDAEGIELEMQLIAALSRIGARIWEVPVQFDSRWRPARGRRNAVMSRVRAVVGARLRGSRLVC